MFAWWTNWQNNRRLRPIVRILPHVLFKWYGGRSYYSAAQVKMALAALNLKSDDESIAYAIACNEAEYRKAQPDQSKATYQVRRTEITKLFGLSRQQFTCGDLRALGRPPRGAQLAPLNDYVSQSSGISWPDADS